MQCSITYLLQQIFVDAAESASRSEKSAGQVKGKKSKDGKESRSSKNQSGSRPASQQLNFDTTKPHWTLRIVTDSSFAVSALCRVYLCFLKN